MRVLDVLRVKPFRGAQVAAGVVVLVTACALAGVRHEADWSDAKHLVYLLPVLGFTGALAVLAPPTDTGLRPWHGALYVAAWIVLLLTLVRVFRETGLAGPFEESDATTALAVCLAFAALPFSRRGAPSMTLLTAGSALVAAVAGGDWVLDLGLPGQRRLLLLVAIGCTLWAVARRDRRPDHARAIAGVGGLAVLGIAGTLLLSTLFGLFGAAAFAGAGDPPATSWLLVLLVAGFGQIAYGCVDQARGSVVLGALALLAFSFLAATRPSTADGLIWLLLLAAGALLVVGLRPARELPPPPGGPAEPPAPLPLFPRR